MHIYTTNIIVHRLNRLTWHDIIPPDEIWIKIGGDKGGTSFKMNFQIMNVSHPNSIHNTCVFAAFEAPDSLFNLHVGLDRYAEQVEDLEGSEWRYSNYGTGTNRICL